MPCMHALSVVGIDYRDFLHVEFVGMLHGFRVGKQNNKTERGPKSKVKACGKVQTFATRGISEVKT